MQKKGTMSLGWAWWLVLIGAAGCGTSGTESVSLELRFASQTQTQDDSGGLPLGIHSFKVEVHQGGIGDPVVGGSGCLQVGESSPERHTIQFDLDPAQNLTLVASGFGVTSCSGQADWMGLAGGVSVVKGKETHVPIFVTRRGLNLNGIRGSLPSASAFATATTLPDGRILVAGGLNNPVLVGGQYELSGVCTAVLYQPGTATFSSPISMPDCRGQHRALFVQGKVLLIGGTNQATLSLTGSVRPLLRPVDAELVSTVLVFDPVTESFTAIGPDSSLRRADAAAVALGDLSVAVLGGRTDLFFSDDIVRGTFLGGDSWTWELSDQVLTVPRSGAQVVTLDSGLLLAGGDDANTVPIEALAKGTLSSTPVSATGAVPVSGHSLVRLTGTQAVMAGGIQNVPGAVPTAAALTLVWSGTAPQSTAGQMKSARAYHAAAVLADGRLVLAGGLDGELRATLSLEAGDSVQSLQTLAGTLSTGAVGQAAALTPDGSVLLAGGLTPQDDGTLTVSKAAQLLSP